MLFALGQTVMTPGVQSLVIAGQVNPAPLLHRHAHGDWGDMDAHDKAMNDAAVKDGSRIMSAYELSKNATVWIITESDRSVTTLLLPSEY